MTVSLKAAAARFLKWNLEGQKHATPLRGSWIESNYSGGGDKDKCTACKIGLVMIGRYGLAKSVDQGGSAKQSLVQSTLSYGPRIDCAVKSCNDQYRNEFGYVVEHLFEYHKWSVHRIDKWLATVAE